MMYIDFGFICVFMILLDICYSTKDNKVNTALWEVAGLPKELLNIISKPNRTYFSDSKPLHPINQPIIIPAQNSSELLSDYFDKFVEVPVRKENKQTTVFSFPSLDPDQQNYSENVAKTSDSQILLMKTRTVDNFADNYESENILLYKKHSKTSTKYDNESKESFLKSLTTNSNKKKTTKPSVCYGKFCLDKHYVTPFKPERLQPIPLSEIHFEDFLLDDTNFHSSINANKNEKFFETSSIPIYNHETSDADIKTTSAFMETPKVDSRGHFDTIAENTDNEIDNAQNINVSVTAQSPDIEKENSSSSFPKLVTDKNILIQNNPAIPTDKFDFIFRKHIRSTVKDPILITDDSNLDTMSTYASLKDINDESSNFDDLIPVLSEIEDAKPNTTSQENPRKKERTKFYPWKPIPRKHNKLNVHSQSRQFSKEFNIQSESNNLGWAIHRHNHHKFNIDKLKKYDTSIVNTVNKSDMGKFDKDYNEAVANLFDIAENVGEVSSETRKKYISRNKLNSTSKILKPKFLRVETLNKNVKLSIVDDLKGLKTDPRDVVMSKRIVISKENMPSLNKIKQFLSHLSRNKLRNEKDSDKVAKSMLPILGEIRRNFQFPATQSIRKSNENNPIGKFFTMASKGILYRHNLDKLLEKY